jgi:hypothetical protein
MPFPLLPLHDQMFINGELPIGIQMKVHPPNSSLNGQMLRIHEMQQEHEFESLIMPSK